jgi:hypothetical protein
MRLLRILGCHDAMFGPRDVLDRAAADGMKALDMARTTKSDMTMRELERLDAGLAACDVPAAADFREQFATR